MKLIRRKSKTILLSSILVCLFIVSFGTNVEGATAAPVLEAVGFSSNYEIQDIPISVVLEFSWADPSFQKMYWVRLYYNVNDNQIDMQYYLGYTWNGVSGEANKRPTLITLIFTSSLYLEEGDVVYFRVGYEWGPNSGAPAPAEYPTKLYKFTIRQPNYEEAIVERNMYLYIAGGVAVFALAVTWIIVKKIRK